MYSNVMLGNKMYIYQINLNVLVYLLLFRIEFLFMCDGLPSWVCVTFTFLEIQCYGHVVDYLDRNEIVSFMPANVLSLANHLED